MEGTDGRLIVNVIFVQHPTLSIVYLNINSKCYFKLLLCQSRSQNLDKVYISMKMQLSKNYQQGKELMSFLEVYQNLMCRNIYKCRSTLPEELLW